MRMMYVLMALLVPLLAHFATADERSETLAMEHSVAAGNGLSSTWRKRGEVRVTTDFSRKKIAIKFSQVASELDDEMLRAFRSAMEEGGLYRVRIASKEDGEGSWMMASVPVCSLAANMFKENLQFHFDKSGGLIGFEHQPLTSATKICDPNEWLTTDKVKIVTKGSAALPQEGYAINKWAGSGKKTKKKGSDASVEVGGNFPEEIGVEEEEDEQEQSFFRKYWYFFIPLAIMTIMGPPAEEGQAAAGATAASTAAASASGGSSSGKKGKRR